MDATSLRQQVGFVAQEPTLFAYSILESTSTRITAHSRSRPDSSPPFGHPDPTSVP